MSLLCSFWCQLSPQLAGNECSKTLSHQTDLCGIKKQYITISLIELVPFLCISIISVRYPWPFERVYDFLSIAISFAISKDKQRPVASYRHCNLNNIRTRAQDWSICGLYLNEFNFLRLFLISSPSLPLLKYFKKSRYAVLDFCE